MLGMGTKLRCTRNLFTNLLNDKHALAANTSDPSVSFNNSLLSIELRTGFHRLQHSMDRFFEPTNKEAVRNVILKHDQIFKQQLHELHRLYRVQKMLMDELRNKEVKLQSLSNPTPRAIMDTQSRFWSSAATLETSYSFINNKGANTLQSNSECSSLQTSNTREEVLRTKNSINLELPAEEGTAREAQAKQDQAIIFRELSKERTGINSSDLWTDGDSELELTLSIGCGQIKNKSRHWLRQDIELVCTKATSSEVRLGGAEECSDFSVQLGKEGLQRPPWLTHALSLNGK